MKAYFHYWKRVGTINIGNKVHTAQTAAAAAPDMTVLAQETAEQAYCIYSANPAALYTSQDDFI